MTDVPFLPKFNNSGSKNKKQKVDWRVVGGGVHDRSSYSAKKKALRKATMRFHPDQFFNKHAARIDPSEIDNIMQRVKECAQQLNDLRNYLEVEKEENEMMGMDFSFTPAPLRQKKRQQPTAAKSPTA